MRRAPGNDILKVLCYVAAVLLLAALIAPWLYNGGKALFEVAGTKVAPVVTKRTLSPLTALADACGRSNFPRFFNRSVMISAVVLFFPLMKWLKVGAGPVRYRDTPWSFRLPDSAIATHEGQPLRRNPLGWLQMLVGFILAAGGLSALAYWLVQAGAFVMVNQTVSTKGAANIFPVQPLHFWKFVPQALFSSLLVAVLEESVFRGALLGIFLRALRPWAAIVGLSLLFAFVHFLDPKTLGAVPDPESSKAGLWLLGKILAQYADPLPLLSSFGTLFGLGGVVAYARWRTASLWLPIGLHAGWVCGIFMFKELTQVVPGLGGLSPFVIGSTLREGLAPLGVVLLTGVVVHFLTRGDAERTPA